MSIGSSIVWAFVVVLAVTCIHTLTKIDAVRRDYWGEVKGVTVVKMPTSEQADEA